MHSSATSELARTQTEQGQDPRAAMDWIRNLLAPDWEKVMAAINHEFEYMDEDAILGILHRARGLTPSGKAYILDCMRKTRELGQKHHKDNALAPITTE